MKKGKIQMEEIFFILLAILLNVIGTVIIKKSLNFHGPIVLSLNFFHDFFRIIISPLFLLGGSIYTVSFIFWIYALSRVDLSFAYPFLALSYVLIILSSKIFLGESISVLRWIGVSIICIGVILISRS